MYLAEYKQCTENKANYTPRMMAVQTFQKIFDLSQLNNLGNINNRILDLILPNCSYIK